MRPRCWRVPPLSVTAGPGRTTRARHAPNTDAAAAAAIGNYPHVITPPTPPERVVNIDPPCPNCLHIKPSVIVAAIPPNTFYYVLYRTDYRVTEHGTFSFSDGRREFTVATLAIQTIRPAGRDSDRWCRRWVGQVQLNSDRVKKCRSAPGLQMGIVQTRQCHSFQEAHQFV